MARKNWKQSTSFTLSKDARKAIRSLAKIKGMSRSLLVEWLILSYMAQTPEAKQ